MRLTRFLLIIILVVVALGGAPAWPSGRVSAAEGWTPLAGQPAAGTAREAVALADGSVLLTGGGGEGGDAFASAVRFDPATGAWRRAADMLTPRFGHTITLLADGRVLVAGGFTIGSLVDATEVYDPVADTWRATGRLTTARARHFAALLPDGRVLAGGGYTGDLYTSSVPLGSTEIYDPATGHWSPAAPMRTARGERLASQLPDGMVLLTGGDGDRDGRAVAAAERYDPTTGRWLDTAPPLAARAGHIAIALGDGSILLAGGYSGVNDGSARPLTTAERYLPTSGGWVAAGTMPTPLVAGVAAPLPDGGALVVGVRLDDNGRGAGLVAARYEALTDSWAPLAPPPGFSGVRTSTALPDGRVLVTGNYRDPRSTVQGPPGATTAALFDGGVPARACFAETGQCVRGHFLAYWEAHGGLALNGYPLSTEFEQRLEDGTIYTVQYFERVRLEYHPENPPPYDVLLGQFGRHILARVPGAPVAPVAAQAGATHFPETDHNVGPRFMAYWQATGGLPQFGYPLSELFEERLEDGSPTTSLVQYFERARLEYHPENAPPYDIELGQFGRQILAENDLLGTSTGSAFGLLYIGNEEVRRTLGAPVGPQETAPGAAQAFERGRMYYRGDTGRITVFCGGVTGIVLLAPGRETAFPNTWTEGQDPGGGPAPGPGLFYPQRGFGKLWRENQRVRDCLGYARTGTEEGYTFAAQPFQRGLMLGAAPSEGRTIYVVALGPFGNGTGPEATYAPYPEPSR